MSLVTCQQIVKIKIKMPKYCRNIVGEFKELFNTPITSDNIYYVKFLGKFGKSMNT